MGKLLLLFIVVPAVELALLIEIGRHIGTLPTLGLIVVTGVLGASLTRRQGVSVWRKAREELRGGSVPTGHLADGIIILIAGALLITPGVLTDAFGFLCLVPAFRSLIKRLATRRLRAAVASGRFRVSGPGVRPAGDWWGQAEQAERGDSDEGPEPFGGADRAGTARRRERGPRSRDFGHVDRAYRPYQPPEGTIIDVEVEDVEEE
jgi:UPF0716 protein FxsA